MLDRHVSASVPEGMYSTSQVVVVVSGADNWTRAKRELAAVLEKTENLPPNLSVLITNGTDVSYTQTRRS
jgi:hypothetical protein